MSGGNGVWDLVVAGAGPAGCALAGKVAASGARVLVLEREEEAGGGRGWIVDVERDTFRQAGVPEPDARASWFEPERQVMFSSSMEHSIELLPSPVRPVRNDIYVRQLVAWASGAGAEVKSGCTVLGPAIEDGAVRGVYYDVGDGSRSIARARLVADCTGISGAVRKGTPRSWGLDSRVDRFDTVLARREVRRVDAEAAAGVLRDGGFPNRVRIDRLGALGAYSTETICLDLDNGYIDILVGVKADASGHPNADQRFREIEMEWPFIGERIFGDGGAIPIRRTLDSLVGDGLLVLGDSACQVIPAHGSGTASALIAADLAARAVVRSLDERRFDRAALWDYNFEFQSGRGAILAYYYALRLHAETLAVPQIDRLLKNGVLAPEDVHSGLVPEPFNASPGLLAKKIAHGSGDIRLLVGFARAGLTAARMMKHYRRYPRRFSDRALEEWRHGVPRPG